MVPVVYTCSIAWTASSLDDCHIISTAALLIYDFIISPSCHIFSTFYFDITITWAAAFVPIIPVVQVSQGDGRRHDIMINVKWRLVVHLHWEDFRSDWQGPPEVHVFAQI